MAGVIAHQSDEFLAIGKEESMQQQRRLKRWVKPAGSDFLKVNVEPKRATRGAKWDPLKNSPMRIRSISQIHPTNLSFRIVKPIYPFDAIGPRKL